MSSDRFIDRQAEDSRHVMEGLPIEPDMWRAINLEAEQTHQRRTPKWLQRLIDAGTLAAFLIALAAAYWLYQRPLAAGFVVIAVIAVLSGWFVATRYLRSQSLRRTRWEVMARHGLPICAGCGYNLTALQSNRCPECGRRINRIHSDNPSGQARTPDDRGSPTHPLRNGNREETGTGTHM